MSQYRVISFTATRFEAGLLYAEFSELEQMVRVFSGLSRFVHAPVTGFFGQNDPSARRR
jgi:hypothetical protein